jgi:GPH family glycoside/pentoside/hexuronide:cation symporter
MTELNSSVRHRYGVGAFALAVGNSAVLFFLFKYLTDSLAISPAAAGAMLMVARAWDAVSDPLLGVVYDQSIASGRIGPRSWLRLAALAWGAVMMMLWSWPFGTSGVVGHASVQLMLLLYFTAYTAVVVPYGTLTVVLARTYQDRTRLNVARMLWSMVGGIVVGVCFPLLAQPKSPTPSWWLAALVMAPFVVGPLLVSSSTAPQRTPHLPGQSRIGNLRKVLSYGRFWRVAAGFSIPWACVSVIAAAIPYLMDSCLGQPERTDIVFAAIQISALLFVVPIGWLAGRLQKHIALSLGLLSWACALMPMALASELSVQVVMLSCILVGPGVAAVHVLPWAQLPDVIELDPEGQGEARSGAYYGAMTFVEKLMSALALGAMGLALESVGYVPEVSEGSPQLQQMLVQIIAVVPACVLVLTALLSFWSPPAKPSELRSSAASA